VPINQTVATTTTDDVGDKHCDMENQQSTSRLVNKENNIYSFLIKIITLNVNEQEAELSLRNRASTAHYTGV